MGNFKVKVWKAVSSVCGCIKENKHMKYLDQNYSLAHISHNHVSSATTYSFKGSYLTMMSNFLQRVVRNDNVLIVKLGKETQK